LAPNERASYRQRSTLDRTWTVVRIPTRLGSSEEARRIA
jgi:hypothetical protein